ncbi:MAG: hypothetical protein J1F05_06905 [Muribaculaceae bacterium]|nr:hypothetical protein [Muribaculaceae bacterium]
MFGFGPDNDFDYEEGGDVGSAYTESSHTNDVDVTVETAATATPERPEVSQEMKKRIFDGVVAIFNESLPDFLSHSIDPQAQSQRLSEALDKDIDEYLNSLIFQAERYAEAKLRGATENAKRESERLRTDIQQIEQQQASLREQKLSADRRHRALAERVADLESQLAKNEAELEQSMLENKSLINKLKVADLQNESATEMAQEIERLKAVIAENKPAVDPEELAAAIARAEKLEGELADARNQIDMNVSMYDDMRKQFLQERDGRQKVEESLAEARNLVDSISEIQAQMELVEDVIRKRDERIEQLKTDNKKLQSELAEVKEAARNALKTATAEEGLFAVGSAVVDKKQETDGKNNLPEEMAAIEDEFECPDWFVSEPAPGEVSPLLQPDPEFGYQEPAKKNRKPENDAQLSLF